MQPDALDKVRQHFITNQTEPTIDLVSDVVRDIFPMSSQYELVGLVDQAISSLFGMGPLEQLLLQPGITDILVNRFDDIWINKGTALVKTDVSFGSEIAAREFAIQLAVRGHRRLDELHPFVDMQLPNGMRFHAVLPPLAVNGTAISIRVPAPASLTLADLFGDGFMTSSMYHILIDIISNRQSFLISGGTGSGKTTLLAAMLSLVDPTHRILIIEDATELNIDHPHVVAVQSRLANSEGLGQISMTDLVRQSLRMRPDRIVVGEVRGREISDLLLALNTGHNGSATTIHANSIYTVPTRIEAFGLLAGLPRAAIHSQMISAFEYVIQLSNFQNGKRGIANIAKFKQGPDGLVVIESLIDSGLTPELQLVA
jgi:pilus assembly protein CpaF